ncbi:hypothetical protein N9602_02425 [Saprospiraceae bacterium]|nr:hypothetical protein [Saprospiraceae bacterium]HCV51610.1 hypothetical protein [Saprospirales bacterium]
MINKNTCLRSLILLGILGMLSNITIAQKNLDTKSGQALTVTIDSTYKHRANKANKSNEDQFMGEEINPLEDPNNFEQNGNPQEKTILSRLKLQLQNIETKSTNDRYQYKKKMNVLKENLKVAKKAEEIGQIEELENQLNSIEVDYDVADMRAKESYNFINKLNKLRNFKPLERVSIINKIIAKSAKSLGTSVNNVQSSQVDYSFAVDDRNPEYITHDEICSITFNGMDESLNQKRIEHAPQHLFGHTSEKLKHVLKNKNFLNCNAYLTLLDGDYYLNLDLELATKDASKSYGYIDKNDMVKLTFINGENFIAHSIYRTEGKLEQYYGHTKYEAVYRLQDIKMELIKDLELDKLAIIWSSGYEEYPVYEIDLLQRQLECIKKAKE